MLKKILLGILITLVVVVVGFAGVVAMQPAEFRIERTATIYAAPTTVFEHINDFHRWDVWSPWAKLDPNCQVSFEGPSSGPGAIFRWSGNDEVGVGSMTILESRPGELVKIKLAFLKPHEGIAESRFTFRPQDNHTVVTWTMTGQNDFMGKAVCLFMDMDDCVGGQFEKGLAQLKSVVETASRQ